MTESDWRKIDLAVLIGFEVFMAVAIIAIVSLLISAW